MSMFNDFINRCAEDCINGDDTITTMFGTTVAAAMQDFDQPGFGANLELDPATASAIYEGRHVAIYRRDPNGAIEHGTRHYLGTALLRICMDDYCVVTLATHPGVGGSYRWSPSLEAWTFGRGNHAIILKVLP